MWKTQSKRRPSYFLGDELRGEKGDLADRIKNKNMPEHVKAAIDKEMKNMGGSSQKSVSMKYVETLLDIPWMESTADVKDIEMAEKTLHEDHTGLKDVKEWIL